MLFVPGLRPFFFGAPCIFSWLASVPCCQAAWSSSLGGSFDPIKLVVSGQQPSVPLLTNAQPQSKTLEEIRKINPYDFQPVVSCLQTMPKAAYPDASWYKSPECLCTGHGFRYKICLFGTNGTDEVEFVFFGDIGCRLVSMDVQALVRTCCRADDTPSEIVVLVSQKYAVVINVTEKCSKLLRRSYQVKHILCSYGRQPIIPVILRSAVISTTTKKKHILQLGSSSTAIVPATEKQSETVEKYGDTYLDDHEEGEGENIGRNQLLPTLDDLADGRFKRLEGRGYSFWCMYTFIVSHASHGLRTCSFCNVLLGCLVYGTYWYQLMLCFTYLLYIWLGFYCLCR
uniref:Replication factor A C-terminal domain-containing protein n=1 Tax=Arundo donax TaxID=35708 RepID=A0A0A9GS83_ARUDO